MSFICDLCGEMFTRKSSLSRHQKRYHITIGTSSKKPKIIVKMHNDQKGSPKNTNRLGTEIEKKNSLLVDTNDINKTDELLMILIKQNQEINKQYEELNKQYEELNKQNQEIKKKLEQLESKPTSNILQIGNTINNVHIYLNEKTDLYKIYEEYGIEDRAKITKLVEMCNEKNKFG